MNTRSKNVCSYPPFALLETLTPDKENKSSFLFSEFTDIITFSPGDSLDLFFKKIESYLNKGFWIAGYFTYEFGYFLEAALKPLAGSSLKPEKPLAWLGVCPRPQIKAGKIKDVCCKDKGLGSYKVSSFKANTDKKEYAAKIKKIKDYLAKGLSYQVNFTFKAKFNFKGSAFSLYKDLRRFQPTSYAAFIDSGKERVLSFSPELFFRADKTKIIARPMKGTIKRGMGLQQDKHLKDELKKDKKTRAENLMIVDLLRNDLGRISDNVRASRLFKVEKYPTLYQMTSTIEAGLRKDLKVKDIFTSLFPCGSVTGAPKIETMRIIKRLEKEPRGVYTGAIGYISPERKFCFNVGIRTAYIRGSKGELGIGGGIVYDSSIEQEYMEALLKAKFFREGIEKV